MVGKNHHLLNSGLLAWLRSTQRSYKAKNCSKYTYKLVEEFPEILHSSDKGTKWHIFSLLVEKYVKVLLIAEEWDGTLILLLGYPSIMEKKAKSLFRFLYLSAHL